MDKPENKHRKKTIPSTWYTVYMAETDEIVAVGTAEDCARQLGMGRTASFRQKASRAKYNGKAKYKILSEKLTEEEMRELLGDE